MARARRTARLAGRRLTSAALSTNERPHRGDVSRLVVANFRGKWTDWYTITSRGDLFPPLARSLLLSLSLAPSTPSISSFYSRARFAFVSLARTYAHSLARFSARLPQIFISGSTANSGRTGRSARDRPGFLTVLTASSSQAATAAAVAVAVVVVVVVHRRTYARLCAPEQHPSESWRDDACLNLNTLWQRREAVPSARVTPSEPSSPSPCRGCHA